MSGTDSSQLVENPAAGRLGQQRALFVQEETVTPWKSFDLINSLRMNGWPIFPNVCGLDPKELLPNDLDQNQHHPMLNKEMMTAAFHSSTGSVTTNSLRQIRTTLLKKIFRTTIQTPRNPMARNIRQKQDSSVRLGHGLHTKHQPRLDQIASHPFHW